MLWFGGILLALVAASLLTRERCAIFSSVTLLGNWAANTIAADVLGSQFEWPLTASIDWASALFLAFACVGRMRLLIVMSYALQMIAHVSYGVAGVWGLVGLRVDQAYWDGLFMIAILQALLVGVWIVGGHHSRHRLRLRRALPDNPGGVPMAQREAGKR